jgi:hypothetical protein
MESLDLFGFFVEHFKVSNIYKYGWQASQEWMAAITGTLLILAISLRSLEEKVSLMQKGKNNMTAFFVTVCLVAVAVVIYQLIVTVIIDFFNAIYTNLGSNNNLIGLGKQLDSLMAIVQDKEYTFEFSEITNGAYFIFAMVIYSVTYGILVFAVIFMRLAHAILVTFVVFWGAVALPMSITTGFKMLAPLKTISLTVLIWPIVDAFFMYLVSSVFYDALLSAGADAELLTNWNLSVILFYLAIFSVINLLLTATTLSAPLISQGLANGSGNITGMVASFGGAAIAGGAIAGKYMTSKLDKVGTKAMHGMGIGGTPNKSSLGLGPQKNSVHNMGSGSGGWKLAPEPQKNSSNMNTPSSPSSTASSSSSNPVSASNSNTLKGSGTEVNSPSSPENNKNLSGSPQSGKTENLNSSTKIDSNSSTATSSNTDSAKTTNSTDNTEPRSNKDSVKSVNEDSLSSPKSVSKTINNLGSESSTGSASSLEGSGEHTDALEDNQDGDERAKEMMDKKASKNRKGAIINQNLKNKVTPNGGK